MREEEESLFSVGGSWEKEPDAKGQREREEKENRPLKGEALGKETRRENMRIKEGGIP